MKNKKEEEKWTTTGFQHYSNHLNISFQFSDKRKENRKKLNKVWKHQLKEKEMQKVIKKREQQQWSAKKRGRKKPLANIDAASKHFKERKSQEKLKKRIK